MSLKQFDAKIEFKRNQPRRRRAWGCNHTLTLQDPLSSRFYHKLKVLVPLPGDRPALDQLDPLQAIPPYLLLHVQNAKSFLTLRVDIEQLESLSRFLADTWEDPKFREAYANWSAFLSLQRTGILPAKGTENSSSEQGARSMPGGDEDAGVDVRD